MEKMLLTAGILALLGASLYMMNNTQNKVILQDGSHIDTQVLDLYKDWKKKFNKKYSSDVEDHHRLSIFKDNYVTIKDFYDGPQQTYTLEFNKFMDVSKQEFTETYLGLRPRMDHGESFNSTEQALDKVDWRTKGVLNEVRDQGACGSCWAFSAIGALESAHALAGKGLNEFSEQELVDCSTSYGNKGCSGGLMDQGFQYVIENGISARAKYPYAGRDQSCQEKNTQDVHRITSFTDIMSHDCIALEQALSKRPVSVAVDASQWQFYNSGVFSNCNDQLNHGVLLVAFNKDEWIIRNSWSTGWGEQGHIRLAKGDTCGVCQVASFPVV